jgi:hypothetical protein
MAPQIPPERIHSAGCQASKCAQWHQIVIIFLNLIFPVSALLCCSWHEVSFILARRVSSKVCIENTLSFYLFPLIAIGFCPKDSYGGILVLEFALHYKSVERNTPEGMLLVKVTQSRRTT